MKYPYSEGLDKFTEQDNSSKSVNTQGIHSYIALDRGIFVSVKVNEIASIEKEAYLASFTVWEGGNDYVDFLVWLNQTLSI